MRGAGDVGRFARTAAMQIGEEVTYNGRRYAVVGFTPLSVTPFKIELFDEETAEAFWIAWPPESAPGAEQPSLHLAAEKGREPAD
jgi:hypothetical protein